MQVSRQTALKKLNGLLQPAGIIGQHSAVEISPQIYFIFPELLSGSSDKEQRKNF
jgi:hypothetical protein